MKPVLATAQPAAQGQPSIANIKLPQVIEATPPRNVETDPKVNSDLKNVLSATNDTLTVKPVKPLALVLKKAQPANQKPLDNDTKLKAAQPSSLAKPPSGSGSKQKQKINSALLKLLKEFKQAQIRKMDADELLEIKTQSGASPFKMDRTLTKSKTKSSVNEDEEPRLAPLSQI